MAGRTPAISYIRYSSERQSRGDSERRQTALSEAFAAARDLDLAPAYTDLGVSAYKGRNKGPGGALGRFLREVEAGIIAKGTYLLVESLDRLSREAVDEALMLFLSIIKAGIVVVTLADNHVYSTETVKENWTQLIISISIMARAHEESDRKSQRLSEAWKDKRSKAAKGGHVLTSLTPAWLRLVNAAGETAEERFEFVEPHATTARMILDRCIKGEGKFTVARRFNSPASKRPTFGGAAEWYPSIIHNILHNPALIGIYQPMSRKRPIGEPFAGYFPPLVTDEVYYQAQAALRSRDSGTGGRKGRTFSNLLTGGIATCARCNASMIYRDKGTAKNGNRWVYLVCSSADNGGCDNHDHVPYVPLEAAVLGVIPQLPLPDDPPASASPVPSTVALEGRKADLLQRIETTDENLQTMKGAAAERMARRLESLEAALAEVEAELKAAQADARERSFAPSAVQARAALVERIAALAEAADLYEARLAVHGALKTTLRVACDHGASRITIFRNPLYVYDVDREGGVKTTPAPWNQPEKVVIDLPETPARLSAAALAKARG